MNVSAAKAVCAPGEIAATALLGFRSGATIGNHRHGAARQSTGTSCTDMLRGPLCRASDRLRGPNLLKVGPAKLSWLNLWLVCPTHCQSYRAPPPPPGQPTSTFVWKPRTSATLTLHPNLRATLRPRVPCTSLAYFSPSTLIAGEKHRK